MEKQCMMSRNEGIWNDVIYLVFVFTRPINVAFLCPGLDRVFRPLMSIKKKPEGCCETYCMAVAHNCMTILSSNQLFVRLADEDSSVIWSTL